MRYYLGFVLSNRMLSCALGAQELPAQLCLLTQLCVTKTFINNNYQFCWSSCILHPNKSHEPRDRIHRFVKHRTITNSMPLAPRPHACNTSISLSVTHEAEPGTGIPTRITRAQVSQIICHKEQNTNIAVHRFQTKAVTGMHAL